MKLLACALLLAASTRVELLDETPTIRRGNWNWYPVSLLQNPATVEADYEVSSGSRQVRLALMTHAEMERRHGKASFDELAGTPPGARGSLIFRVPRPDEYGIVVDNSDGNQDTAVHVRVSLDFAPPHVTRLSPQRQITVIALSFAFFFAVVTWSARRILRAIRS
jgi:hypothetical protein